MNFQLVDTSGTNAAPATNQPIPVQTTGGPTGGVTLQISQKELEALKQLVETGEQFNAKVVSSSKDSISLLIKGQVVKFSSTQSFSPSTTLLLMLGEKDGKDFLQLLKTSEGSTGTIPGKSALPKPALEAKTATIFQKIMDTISPPLSMKSLREMLSPKNILPPTTPTLPGAAPQVQQQESAAVQFFKEIGLSSYEFSHPRKMVQMLKTLAGMQTAPSSTSKTPETPQQPLPKTTLSLLTQIQTELTNSLLQPSAKTAPAFGVLLNLLTQEMNRFGAPHGEKAGLSKAQQSLLLVREALVELSDPKTRGGNNRIALTTLVQITQLLDSSSTSAARSSGTMNPAAQLADLLGAVTKLPNSNAENGRTPAHALIENFVQGQEALQRMNTVMQQVGEPLFLLMPGFLQGLLQNLEVTIYPRTDGGEGEESKGSSHSGYQRLSLSFTFPRLGPVRVDMAYSMEHVLMSISSESEAKVEYIDRHLYLLESALHRLGFSRAELVARKTLPDQPTVKPKWFTEAIGTKAIA